MKKITLLSLIGLILSADLFAQMYDTVSIRNGTTLELQLAPKERIFIGRYDVPLELTDKQARDMIEGRIEGLEIISSAGSLPKEILLLDFVDCFRKDSYIYLPGLGAIKHRPTVVWEERMNWLGVVLVIVLGFIIPAPFLFFLGLPNGYSNQVSEPLKRIAYSLAVYMAAIMIAVAYGFWTNPSGLLVLGEAAALAIIAGIVSKTFSNIVTVFFSAGMLGAFAKFTGALDASCYGLIEYVCIMFFICCCSFAFWWHKNWVSQKTHQLQGDHFMHV